MPQRDGPRYSWGRRFIQFRQDDAYPSKQKFGLANKQGWATYHLGQQLFIKTFDWLEGKTYPDCGCNCELFTMPGFLEIETLGPLEPIAPGQAAAHRESWFLFDALDLPHIEAPLFLALAPILKETA